MNIDEQINSSFITSSGRHLEFYFHKGEGLPMVFLNGLSDSMESWRAVLTLESIKRPVLLVDLPGQGRSLEREISSNQKLSFCLSVEEQVGFLLELLESLNIEKFGLVGFSYGGGVALGAATLVPNRIAELILFLPFILRLDLSFPMARMWVTQFDFLKSLTPKSLRQPFFVLERSYEQFINNYMNYRYLNRIPNETVRSVAVELSRGIMDFNSFDVISKLPENKMVLVTSGRDTLVPQSLYQEFWYRLPKEKKKSWIHVLNGEHLLLEQAPQFVSKTLVRALAGELEGVQKVHLEV